MREWLPEDHLAWFVIEAIDALDLERRDKAIRCGSGRLDRAYVDRKDPPARGCERIVFR